MLLMFISCIKILFDIISSRKSSAVVLHINCSYREKKTSGLTYFRGHQFHGFTDNQR